MLGVSLAAVDVDNFPKSASTSDLSIRIIISELFKVMSNVILKVTICVMCINKYVVANNNILL